MVLANFNSIIKNLYKIAKHMQCIYIYIYVYIYPWKCIYICTEYSSLKWSISELL